MYPYFRGGLGCKSTGKSPLQMLPVLAVVLGLSQLLEGVMEGMGEA